MAQIKIKYTSNADMNIGVPKQITMAQKTAVIWLHEKLQETYDKEGKLPFAYTLYLVEQAKQMERQQLFDAMMYALDEDGHTGEWKVKFINDYIDNL